MTQEELLKPRFKLIEDYPGNSREIGSISVEIATASYFRKYKANFRELQWWQDRDEKDMPEYVKVKCVINPSVHKVDRFDLESTSRWFMFIDKGIHPYAPADFLPATEAEYLTFKNKKQ